MNVRLHMTAPAKRLAKPEPIPSVQCSEADARSFFDGWWKGIGVGFVIGLSISVLLVA